MSVNLSKGQKLNLSKERKGLSQVMVGLGWDEAGSDSKGGLFGLFKPKSVAIDCDASAILCGQMERLLVMTSIRPVSFMGI